MKVGILRPTRLGHSHGIYIDNVKRGLDSLGVESLFFSQKDKPPRKVDLYWDPRAGGGRAPFKTLHSLAKPLVVTVHGASPFALPAKEHYNSISKAAYNMLFNYKKILDWRLFANRYAAIITVSAFAKAEIQKYLPIDGGKIFVAHHGVDYSVFHTRERCDSEQDEPYFLHVSTYQPLKNFDRILAAYSNLPVTSRPRLVAVCPGYKKEIICKGVELTTAKLNHIELARLYQGAIGFICPSLRESFGMPILEAMACGCPVITSDVSACPEVAGDAALLVNPRSIESIGDAMSELVKDSCLRSLMREKGLARVRKFSWGKSAETHLRIFQKAVSE